MNFQNAKELKNHAMKAAYGWRRFFMPVPKSIKDDVQKTVVRVTRKDSDFDEYQARLDFVRKYPIKD